LTRHKYHIASTDKFNSPDTEIDGNDNSEIAAIIIRASVLPLNVSIPNLDYTSGFVIEGKIERQAIFLNTR
jgi:hypothetical protein